MRGGKYIARGAYGCVYLPSIQGTGHESNKSTISKLILKNNVYDEYYNTQFLKEIDPTNKYLIYPIAKTNITYSDIEQADELKNCSLIADKFAEILYVKEELLKQVNDHFFNILQPNGGMNLSTYLKVKRPLKEMTEKLLNLFKGVLLLNNNDVYHRDIKTDNIVVEPTFRLIDFGIATKEVNINSYDHKDFAGAVYEIWPMDYIIMSSGRNKDSLKDTMRYISDKYSSMNKDIIRNKSYLLETINNFIKNKYYNKSEDYLSEIFEKCVESMDCYSLGFILIACLNNIIDVTDPTQSDEFEVLDVLVKLNLLSLKMINGDPYKRITIKDATVEFIRITVPADLVDSEIIKLDALM